jgi:hypothetical protein
MRLLGSGVFARVTIIQSPLSLRGQLGHSRLMASRPRASADVTVSELARNLSSWFPDGRATISAVGEITFPEFPTSARTIRPVWVEATKTLVAPVSDEDSIIAVVRVHFHRKLSGIDVSVAGALVRVFNQDIAAAPLLEAHQELWISLQQTRFMRAISRLAPFHTAHFMRWLRQLENASTLRYENKPFAATILLTKQVKWVTGNESLNCVRFPDGLPTERALFGEKWLRALTQSRELGLVALGHGMGFWGVFRLPPPTTACPINPPHKSLRGLCSALIPGTMSIVVTEFGDYYALFPNGCIFLKTQGHWFYLSIEHIREALEKSVGSALAEAVVSLSLDLGYERKGALIVVLDDPKAAHLLVPDHNLAGRSNDALRTFSRRLNLLRESHREIVKDIATIDGALLLSKTGKILDAGCMITDPKIIDVQAKGHRELRKFPGARSTAAWNSSIYGTSVKISEDGPIDVFRDGERLARVG